MRITITDNDGIVLDQFNVEKEIGNVDKPMPAAMLLDRIREAASVLYKAKIAAYLELPSE